MSEQVLGIVAELYNQKFTKENSLNGILLYPIKSVNNFVDPLWKQEMELKKKAAWEDYRKLEKEVKEAIKIKNEPNLALLEEKIKQYSIFLDSIEDLLNEMDELSNTTLKVGKHKGKNINTFRSPYKKSGGNQYIAKV